MIFKTDIIKRIETDFGDKSSDAFKILKNAIEKTEYLNSDRIIRCILYLAEKNIEKLKEHIEAAIGDPRDVMYWAEYINRDGFESAKRVRDLNKTFEESEIGVKE
jgi:hypothetical protein